MTEPEWWFEVDTVTPDGIRISVNITVPAAAAWKHVREVSEIAQMAANAAVVQIISSQQRTELP